MGLGNPQQQGTPVALLDEGVQVAASLGSLNFVGAGVTATAAGSAGTATIPGGAGGTNTATDKVTPVTSGNNITLDLTTLSHVFTTIQFVTKNGQTLDPNDATYGWSRSVNTITVLNASNTDVFLVNYNY